MHFSIIKKNYLFFNTLVLPVLLFGITAAVFGFWYGWLDDPIFDNYFRGVFSSEPITNLFVYHVFLSKMYVKLYQVFPEFPWYGFFLTLYIFLATTAVFYFISKVFERLRFGGLITTLVNVVFFFLIWFDNVYLLNYTNIAFLLMGASMLCLVHLVLWDKSSISDRSKLGKVAWFTFLFAIGYHVRPSMVSFPLGIGVLLLAVGLLVNFKEKISEVWIVILPPILVIALSFGIENVGKSPDSKHFDRVWPYIHNLLNGFNYDDKWRSEMEATPEGAITLFSLQTWFFQDEGVFNEEYLAGAGGNSAFTLKTLGNWQKNLLTEYQKARYEYSDYYKAAIWYGKVLIFMGTAAALMTLAFFLFILAPDRRNQAIGLFLFQAGCVGIILLTTIFVKMEDRVFTPFMVTFFAANLALIGQTFPGIREFLEKKMLIGWGFVVLFVSLTLMRFPLYFETCQERKQEILYKAQIIEEIDNKFSDKYILFDIWTMAMIHGSPFHHIKPSSHNTLLAYGENWLNIWGSHRQLLRSICGTHEALPFFNCLQEKREQVVFAMTEIRVDLFHDYFQLLYGTEFNFKPAFENSSISRLKNSWVGTPMKYDFYVFDEE